MFIEDLAISGSSAETGMTQAKIRAELEPMILIDILLPAIYRKFDVLVRIFKDIWR